MTREEARRKIGDIIHWAESPYTGYIYTRLPHGLHAYFVRVGKRRTVIEVWKTGDDRPMKKIYGNIRKSEPKLKKLAITYMVNNEL